MATWGIVYKVPFRLAISNLRPHHPQRSDAGGRRLFPDAGLTHAWRRYRRGSTLGPCTFSSEFGRVVGLLTHLRARRAQCTKSIFPVFAVWATYWGSWSRLLSVAWGGGQGPTWAIAWNSSQFYGAHLLSGKLVSLLCISSSIVASGT